MRSERRKIGEEDAQELRPGAHDFYPAMAEKIKDEDAGFFSMAWATWLEEARNHAACREEKKKDQQREEDKTVGGQDEIDIFRFHFLLIIF
jgi:hypothetical protein